MLLLGLQKFTTDKLLLTVQR